MTIFQNSVISIWNILDTNIMNIEIDSISQAVKYDSINFLTKTES